MSETIEAPAAEPEAVPAPAADTPAPAETTTTEASAEPAAPTPGEEPWRKVRIEQMAREKNEERRARQLAERELAEARKLVEELRAGTTGNDAALTAAQIDAEAQRRVVAELAAREQDAKNERFNEIGSKEFPDFHERCNAVAAMGAAGRPEFMQLIGDLGETGPRVVMHMADNPTEAMRILALPPHAMGLALARLEMKVQPKPPAPKPVTAAPKPIAPVAGTTVAAPDLNDPGMSMKEWHAIRQKQREKAGAR